MLKVVGLIRELSNVNHIDTKKPAIPVDDGFRVLGSSTGASNDQSCRSGARHLTSSNSDRDAGGYKSIDTYDRGWASS
jgi:hypothetical protein